MTPLVRVGRAVAEMREQGNTINLTEGVMRLFSREPMSADDQGELLATRTEPEQVRVLQEYLARPRVEQTARELLSILDQFVDAAAHESQRDEGRAYLSEVLAESPNSTREVETLHCADDAGHSRLDELRDQVVRQLSQACVSEEIRQELQAWAQSLAAQRRHENRLVNESLNRDTGGES